jgi:hypothetical protein
MLLTFFLSLIHQTAHNCGYNKDKQLTLHQLKAFIQDSYLVWHNVLQTLTNDTTLSFIKNELPNFNQVLPIKFKVNLNTSSDSSKLAHKVDE